MPKTLEQKALEKIVKAEKQQIMNIFDEVKKTEPRFRYWTIQRRTKDDETYYTVSVARHIISIQYEKITDEQYEKIMSDYEKLDFAKFFKLKLINCSLIK